MLVDSAGHVKWGVKLVQGQSVLEYLLARGLHPALRRLLQAIVSSAQDALLPDED